MEKKLTIELVPQTCWYSNVRSNVSTKDWDILRKTSYSKADYKCKICGDKGTAHPVECHEIWEYDDKNHIQKLIGLVSLCPRCHEVKHIGLAQIRGREDQAIEQLMRVNKISLLEARQMISKAFDVWQRRSTYDWTLNIDLLKVLLK